MYFTKKEREKKHYFSDMGACLNFTKYMLLFSTSCILMEFSKTISSLPVTKTKYQSTVDYESIFLEGN